MRKFISMAKITKDTTVNQSTPVSKQPEKKVVEEKLNSFEKDLSAENFKEYKKYIPFKNLNCIKYRISHT